MADRKKAPAADGLDIRIAWQRNDPQIIADAIAFWDRLKLLPAGVNPVERAQDIIAAAYEAGQLIALAAASIEYMPSMKANMAVLRGATDPAHRRSHAQIALAVPSHDALRDWALANPEERLGGAVAFVDPSEWGDFLKIPVWPGSLLEVIGYSADGKQVRARWFDHFRFD